MLKTLFVIAVVMLVALFAAPVAADGPGLIIVNANDGTAQIIEDDPTGNAPPPLVAITTPNNAFAPPTQDGICGGLPVCGD